MPIVRVYNYPWAGRLGRIAKKCLFCGHSGKRFQFSSHAVRCADCTGSEIPIPHLLQEYNDLAIKLARAWCEEHGLDYDEIKKNLFDFWGGPPDQEKPEGWVPEDEPKTSYAILTLVPKGEQFMVDAALYHNTTDSQCVSTRVRHDIPPFFVFAENAAEAKEKAKKIILPADLEYESCEVVINVHATRKLL